MTSAIPPFGHDGERALDQLMTKYGGFEGNAQTLRILPRLEKKEIEPRALLDARGNDNRVGLNLTYRTIASILKYDREIPITRSASAGVKKGYYHTEAPIVTAVKSDIAPKVGPGIFKTIECSIMDLADDIAYSTYDLEDAFKAGFLSPISMAAANDKLKARIAEVVNQKLMLNYPKALWENELLTIDGVDRIVLFLLSALFRPSEDLIERISTKNMTND
jgi:dGTPase